MQSPKFKFLRSELLSVFSSAKLTEEWKKRVGYQIRKQLVFDPIEYRDFKENITTYIDQVIHEISSGGYKVRASKRYLAEKSRGLCRQMTLIHPIDLLVLERLSRSFYFELQSKRPSNSAFFEPDDGSFIKGFQQVDFQYGSYASWRRFQKAVFGFAKDNKFVIVTDVANFYDFINFQHLRNIISSLAAVRESVLDLLIHILNRLTWTPDFMPLSQTGMPQIETTATRVLANAMLYEVDKICESFASLNYARFMDDMDIGVDSIPKAKTIIRDIDLTLQARQLRLNSSKTKILSAKEAWIHFCIRENIVLSMYEKRISNPRWSPHMQTITLLRYQGWANTDARGELGEKSPFRRSNGSKIHKQSLKLVYEANGHVPEKDLMWLIRNDPAMRSTALRYLSRTTRANTVLKDLLDIMKKGAFVDDAAMVDMANFLVHAKFRVTKRTTDRVRQVVKLMEVHSDIAFHAAIFVACRFLYTAEILSMLRRNANRIRSDFWLARAAAGAFPVFLRSKHHFVIFQSFIRSLRSEDAENVLSYFMNLTTTPALSRSQKDYLAAANGTYPQKIYFPKVLQLLAVTHNPSLSAGIPSLLAKHPALSTDRYYKQMGFP